MPNTEETRQPKICTACGHANRPLANFCGDCGEPLPERTLCAQCGEECVQGARFCHMCGASVVRAGVQHGPGDARRAAAALLANSLQWAAGLARPLAPEEADEPEEPPARPGPAPSVPNAEPASPATLRANVCWGIAAILAAAGAQWLLGLGRTVPALGLYAAGVALAVWAFRLNKEDALPAALPGTAWRLPAKWLAAALLLPLIPAALSLTRLLTDPRQPPSSFWLLHFAGILLFIVCIYLVDRRSARAGAPSRSRPERARRPWTGWERLAAIAVLCAGLFVRLYDLPGLPFGTWYDEADFALQAQRILQDPAYRPLFIDSIHGPAHYTYLVAALFTALPEVTFVIRLASVLLGTLSVPAAFVAGNQLFGRGPGLMLAFLVAVSRWSFNFSRIGMYNIPVTLFTFLGIALLLRALRSNRLTDYMWAGLLLGFGYNFYHAFTLFLMVVSLFVLRYFVSHFGLLRHQWKGLLVTALGVLLFLAPLAVFAQEEPEIFFRRTRTVSIFNEFPPEEVADKVLESAAAHLLMFNVRGDANGRHNLPREPMLAPVAGALFVLGLGMSLASLWRRRSLLLLAWLLVMMSGGVFSLSFEAPQSLRAIGALPAVYLLATLPLTHLWQNWRAAAAGVSGQGERVQGWGSALRAPGALGQRLQLLVIRPGPLVFVCVLLCAVAVHNYRVYFVEQRNSFPVWNAYSTGQSIAATVLAESAARGDTDIFLTSRFAHHPTVRFVGDAESSYASVDYTASLPLPLSPDRGALFLMDPDRRNFVEQARRFYPDGTFVEHRPPFGGPVVLYEVRLRPEDTASVQGVELSYFAGEAWSGAPVRVERHAEVSVAWPGEAPLAGPFSAEWNGVLNIEQYGAHRFVLRAPAAAELYVDEELVARVGQGSAPDGAVGNGEGSGSEDSGSEGNGEASAALRLALGLHKLRLRAVGGDGRVTLSWQRPGEAEGIVPSSALHVRPVESNGLLGRYYANGNWEGTPAFTRIDPQIALYFHDAPLPSPYTVEWEGKLVAPDAGVYRLGIESIDASELWVDGKRVAASIGANEYTEGVMTLTAGLHDIRIRYAARTSHHHVNLSWAPPGQARMLVDAEALIPPQGSYEHLADADLGLFDGPPGATFAGVPLEIRPLPVDGWQEVPFEIVSEGFERPRGVTAANGRYYVADPGGRMLLVLDSGGRETARIRRSDGRFREPVDVAADGAGNIYVLDAGDGGRVSVHDAAGEFVRMAPLPEGLLGNSRGLDVDGEGRIWVALTPAMAVAAFDADGREVARISTALADGEFQPVDVAYAGDEAVYVSTVGSNAVIRFSLRGEPLRLWSLTEANSMDGPHLALDGSGDLYVTQPEQGGILRIRGDEDGEVEAWALPAGDPVRKLVGIGLGPSGGLVVTDSEGGSVYLVFLSP